MQMQGTIRFIRYYIQSMRLYYAFITGISGWIGVSFYHFLFPDRADPIRSGIILTLLFLSWGVNQIVNDYLGLAEDKINAPQRPMVNGNLPVKAALCTTGVCIGITLATAYWLNPVAVIPVIVGVLLNVLYEYSKAYSIWANIIFGLMITMCPIFGFLASGPMPEQLITSNRLAVLALIAIINGVMTYYTYFKDYLGDKTAGKRTFVVKYGIVTARYAGLVAALISAIACVLFIKTDALPLYDILFQKEFLFIAMVTLFLQCWTGYLYFCHPAGPRTYFNLVTNIRACTAGYCAILAIFNGQLALYLLIISYILIGFFFDFYKDAQS